MGWDMSRAQSSADRPNEWMSSRIDASSMAVVRQRVRELLAGRADLLIEDAVQVTDELVSNAYRHGQSPRAVRLTLIDAGRRLRIEVDDASPLDPMPRTPDRTGGLGIMLVHRLASSWGAHRHERHKTVWAEVDLASSGAHGHAAHLTSVPMSPPDA